MNSASGLPKNINFTLVGSQAARAHWDRRSSRRCKIAQAMRIRPSDPQLEPFEDIRKTLSVSQTGFYFRSSKPDYEVGMRLFVATPYGEEDAEMACEYLAEVVRRDSLSNGLFGIGLRILGDMSLQ